MSNLSSAEIGNLIAIKENELKEALRSQELVDLEEIAISKQILQLRIKKKDIETACSKAHHNVRAIQIDLKKLEGEFWAAKNSGL